MTIFLNYLRLVDQGGLAQRAFYVRGLVDLFSYSFTVGCDCPLEADIIIN